MTTREDLQPYFDAYPDEDKMFVVGEGVERQEFTGSQEIHARNYAIRGRKMLTFYRDPLDEKDDDEEEVEDPSVSSDFLTEKDLTKVTKAVENLVKVK